MGPKLPTSFFVNNRGRLLKNSKAKVIVISANGLMQSSADQAFDFVQEANFYYLTGINDPGIILVLTKKEEFLILPKTNDYITTFDGLVNKEELTKQSGIENIYEHEEGISRLTKIVKKHKILHSLSPMDKTLKVYSHHALPFRRMLIDQLKRINPDVEIKDLSKSLSHMRMVKDKNEIKLISHAISITKDSILKTLGPGKIDKISTTGEVEIKLEANFKLLGSQGNAFTPVISTREKSVIIHYIKSDQKLKSGSLLLVDVGAKFNHYCADITRTLPYGKITSRQKDVIKAVSEVQQHIIKLVKPGLTLADLEEATESKIGEKLIELGLIEKLDKKQIRKYYPHAVSHHLGLDTHDLADYSLPLEPNMVITIEPGIYIENEAIGVRIEDDILVTKTGSKVL